MEYQDLREWIEQVRPTGEIRDVRGATWEEDIGRVTEMLHHTDDSPAVLFDDIPGYPHGYRILVNANATRRRLALTLGLPQDIERRPLMDEFLRMTEEGRAIKPRFVKDGPVMENVQRGDDVDVLKFPAPFWHPLDGGRYLGTGVVDILKDPDSDWVNLGTYRVMVQDRKRVSVYISPGKHGRQFRDAYFKRHQPCPIAVVIGVDPLLFIGSSLEVPQGVSEYDWVGGIRGEPYEVIKGPVTGLPIPARAEIVLEGFLRDDVRAPEGPFGEWTGYYASGEREEPVLDVQAVYHRNDPIILGVPPNKPPYEPHRYREYLRSALLLRELKAAGVPGVVDAHCFGVGGCRLFLAVSIQARYAGHARQAGHVAAMCRVGAYLGRLVVVVDEDIDVTDINDVMWAVLTRSDPERSLDIIHRAWSGPLDPAIHPDEKGHNSRLIIDATKPWEWRDRFPIAIGPDAETKRETRKKWGHLLKAVEPGDPASERVQGKGPLRSAATASGDKIRAAIPAK